MAENDELVSEETPDENEPTYPPTPASQTEPETDAANYDEPTDETRARPERLEALAERKEDEQEEDPTPPEGEKWEPALQNVPSGIHEQAQRGIESAQKSQDDAVRTVQQLARPPEPPKCYVTNNGGDWSWSYGRQGGTGFGSKAEVLADARENLVPMLDGNGEPLNVQYEVVT